MREEPSYKGDKGILNEKEHQVINQRNLMINSDLRKRIYGENLEFEEELSSSAASSYRSNVRKKAVEMNEELRQFMHDMIILTNFLGKEDTEGLSAYEGVSEEEIREEMSSTLQNTLPFLLRWLKPVQKRELVKSILVDGTYWKEERFSELIFPLHDFLEDEVEDQNKRAEIMPRLQNIMEEDRKFHEIIRSSLETHMSVDEGQKLTKELYPDFQGDLERLESMDDSEIRHLVFDIVPELEERHKIAGLENMLQENDMTDEIEILKVLSKEQEKNLSQHLSSNDESKYGDLVELLSQEGHFNGGKLSKGGLASRRVRPACIKLEEKELIEYNEKEWRLTELGQRLSAKLGFSPD